MRSPRGDQRALLLRTRTRCLLPSAFMIHKDDSCSSPKAALIHFAWAARTYVELRAWATPSAFRALALATSIASIARSSGCWTMRSHVEFEPAWPSSFSS